MKMSYLVTSRSNCSDVVMLFPPFCVRQLISRSTIYSSIAANPRTLSPDQTGFNANGALIRILFSYDQR